MAAALGKVLILDLNRVGAGAFQKAHGALHIERIAVAGVSIDNEMCADAVANERDGLHHLAHPDQADVRTAEPRVSDAGAGDIKRFEARALGDEPGQSVIHAGGDQDW